MSSEKCDTCDTITRPVRVWIVVCRRLLVAPIFLTDKELEETCVVPPAFINGLASIAYCSASSLAGVSPVSCESSSLPASAIPSASFESLTSGASFACAADQSGDDLVTRLEQQLVEEGSGFLPSHQLLRAVIRCSVFVYAHFWSVITERNHHLHRRDSPVGCFSAQLDVGE